VHHGKPLPDGFMRWLMLVLLVSLMALLMAAAGMVRHVWRHRMALRRAGKASASRDEGIAVAVGSSDEELDVR
jgi:cell division protein FtsL